MMLGARGFWTKGKNFCSFFGEGVHSTRHPTYRLGTRLYTACLILVLRVIKAQTTHNWFERQWTGCGLHGATLSLFPTQIRNFMHHTVNEHWRYPSKLNRETMFRWIPCISLWDRMVYNGFISSGGFSLLSCAIFQSSGAQIYEQQNSTLVRGDLNTGMENVPSASPLESHCSFWDKSSSDSHLMTKTLWSLAK